MRLFDSHAHIDDISFNQDFNQIMERADASGVKAVMVVGINLETVQKAIKLVETHANLFTSVGVHPHDANTCSEAVMSSLKTLACHKKVKAWGETGLDFNRMHSPVDLQEKWFIRQIEAADEAGLPMIFHERDSRGRLLEILTAMDNKKRQGVIHCFSGTREEMFKYLDLGYHIGITGIVTIQKRGRYLRELVPHIPQDRLLIETDAPYLTPAPMKNKIRRNEPAFVAAVLNKIAAIRNNDPHELAETIWTNTLNLYNIHELRA
ncbi:TatD DNase family protein [Desulfocicer vacuolatum DSM 3385]|uniref:TatD DNase family protein n=1 Tax=Desulfocicer vacuolatum DSM 3385 TaxID=1121400 RepID=A0A1W1ZRU6_9BACT|nr:TatD family hydrolase [Desulfocicer vacuolatum]SMC51136.1 TatD DNase family protein [Desulfocicer vacuolatum DSM 3385]